MDIKITSTKTVLLAMDPRRTHVVRQLSYNNSMLYLPLPKPPECMSTSTSQTKNNIVIAPGENKETRPGHISA